MTDMRIDIVLALNVIALIACCASVYFSHVVGRALERQRVALRQQRDALEAQRRVLERAS